jgi:hypothetical protein
MQQHAIASELARIIDETLPQLRSVSETAASKKPKPETWSAKEIVGHLVDSAANNHQRFIRAQQTSELTLPGYEQDAWVRAQDYQNQQWREIVDFWASYNRVLAQIIRRLPESAMNTSCRIGNDAPKPLRDIVEHYVTHLRHHLAQIHERIA